MRLRESSPVDAGETACFLGLPPATLHQLNYKGTGPRSFKVGRHRRYDPDDVRAWLESRASTGRKL